MAGKGGRETTESWRRRRRREGEAGRRRRRRRREGSVEKETSGHKMATGLAAETT